MRIVKYLHSCLLVEEGGTTILVDPGIYTAQAGALDVAALKSVSYLLITHEHPDHFYLPLIKQVMERFPSVRVVTNESVADQMKAEGMNAATEGEGPVAMEPVPHERIFMYPNVPPNAAFHIFEKLTHPGDSLSFASTKEVLALPVQAPWGSTTWAVDKALEVKPRVVIPIHDWHWRDEARKWMYERLSETFKSRGIDFLGIDPGEEVVV